MCPSLLGLSREQGNVMSRDYIGVMSLIIPYEPPFRSCHETTYTSFLCENNASSVLDLSPKR